MNDELSSLDRHGFHFEFDPEDRDVLGMWLYGLNGQQRLDLLRATINDRDGKYAIKLPLRGGGFRNFIVTCKSGPEGRILTFKRSGT